MRRLAALLALAALAAGCSHRQRLNPLDPANPQTGGRPAGFNAIAGDGSIRLVWQPQPSLAIDGFELQRLAPRDSVYRALGSLLPPSSGTFLDSGALNGQDYRYRLYFVIGGALGAQPAEDVATPGPLAPWVVDPDAGALVRLSPDGRDVVLARTDLSEPSSVAVDPGTGLVWVAEPFAGDVQVLNPTTLAGVTLPGLGEPFTIAIAGNASGWICDLTGSLWHFAASGATVSPGRIGLLANPDGVAIGPRDSSVWVCEHDGNRVRRYDATGVPQATGTVPAPSRVAVDSLTGVAWVTAFDRGRVYRLRADGSLVDSLALAGPIGLSLDWRRRRAWIADAAGDAVVVVDMDTGRTVQRITGMREPRDVAVDLASGEAWVAAFLDGAVVRLSPTGVTLTRVAGFAGPYAIALDPGVR